MEASGGRREEHRRATRAALREAARRLFAEQGYERTTVRDIARAAGVNERTLYRYFDGKEGFLAEEALGWVDRLCAAIRARPAEEPPLPAVRQGMAEVARDAAAGPGPGPLWLFWGRAGGSSPLRRATPRPLLHLEEAIAAAILDRLKAERTTGRASRADPDPDDPEFEAQVLARVAVAALRSAVIRRRALLAAPGRPPKIESLVGEAFTILVRAAGERRRETA